MRHVGARALTRYHEGMLRARKAARVAAHLSACPLCSGAHSGLEAISRLLAGTPAPSIPDAVADRIHNTLVAEAAARTVSATTGADRAAAPARHARRERAVPSSRPMLLSPLMVRGLAAAASIAVVAGVGYVFATNALGPASAPSATSPPSPAAHQGGTAEPFGRQRQVTYGTSQQRASALATGADYTPGNLASLVRRDVANASRALLPDITAQPSGGHFPGLINGMSESQLAGCLADIDHGRRVLVADVAEYLGRPATIIVLRPLLAAASVFDVVVVGPACSRTTPDIIATIEVPVH